MTPIEQLEEENRVLEGINKAQAREIKHVRDQWAAVVRQREELVFVLEQCRMIFHSYVGAHERKNPPDTEKAQANLSYAALCGQAIDNVKGGAA